MGHLIELYDIWSLYDINKKMQLVSTVIPLVRTCIGQFVFAQPKLICSQGRREGPVYFERFFHVNFKHMTRMTWKKSSNFSRTSYLYLVNGYLKATFCQHWFKHPATPIEIFSALDQETMVTRLIFNMSRVKKSCWFKKEGVLLYRYMNMHIRSYIHTCISISIHISIASN